MIVRELFMQGFLSHTAGTLVKLPASGVVLVTGPNGAGKSSLIEAVSVGAWGKSLRGTSPWQAGHKGAMVQVSDGNVRLTRDGPDAPSKVKLSWSVGGMPATRFDTTTKAQAALEREVGTHDVWRRTCAFSSQDASHFTLATDAERKRLLETILGLERFDAASTACRVDLNAAAKAHTAAKHAFELRKVRLEGEQQRRADAEAALGELEVPEDFDLLRAEFDALDKLVNDAMMAKLDDQRAVRITQEQLAQLRERARAAEQEVARMERGHCPSCERPWDAQRLAAARAEAARRRADADTQGATLALLLAAQQLNADEAVEQEGALLAKRQRVTERAARARALSDQRIKLEAVLRAVTDDHDAAEEVMREHAVRVATAEAEVAALQATDRVLCLTGVRAQLLTGALDGIEQVANAWLGRIAGWGLRLELRPYAEKASGGVRDAISLEVHGAGGGYGYRASSGGERRRIDVALLLALAEVAASAHGTAPSTMFFDEVFDALDTDGIDAVCGALEELAQDRAVVVITHTPALEERLRPDLITARLHVAAGTITDRAAPEIEDAPELATL